MMPVDCQDFLSALKLDTSCLNDSIVSTTNCFLFQGSKTFSLPAQSYDLFLTAAIADGVKIWDLRTTR